MHSMLLLAAVDCNDQIASILEPNPDVDLAYEADLIGDWVSATLAQSERQHELLTEIEWFRQGHQPESSQPLPMVWES